MERRNSKKMNPFYRNLAFWLLISLFMIFMFNVFNKGQTPHKNIIFSDFLNMVNNGEVIAVTIQGNRIEGTTTSGTQFKTYSPNYPDLVKLLQKKAVKITAKPQDTKDWKKRYQYLTQRLEFLENLQQDQKDEWE